MDIRIKQFIREFFTGKMNEAKRRHGMTTVPAIIVREEELEKFIDDLWFDISKKEYGAQHPGT